MEFRQIAQQLGIEKYPEQLDEIYSSGRYKEVDIFDEALMEYLQQTYESFGNYYNEVVAGARELKNDPIRTAYTQTVAVFVQEADIVVSHGASGSIMKALNAGKKVIAVTRLEKYGEHINDHQIQNNEAFSMNGYVLMADLELENLGECFVKIAKGLDGLRAWENKDPMAIVNRIDQFIQENWNR